MAEFDPADSIDRARKVVAERAELPGMSLMEHLGELRKRLLHSLYYLIGGFAVAYFFHVQLFDFIMAPYTQLHLGPLNITHPTDALNLYIKTSLVMGAIISSPFILYQVWLFIAPGMYANEKRYVWPFMSTTVILFLSGAWFGYHYFLPGALKVLILDFGSHFHAIITTRTTPASSSPSFSALASPSSCPSSSFFWPSSASSTASSSSGIFVTPSWPSSSSPPPSAQRPTRSACVFSRAQCSFSI